MLKRLSAMLKIAVTGASQERCLNRWTAKDLPFWNYQKISELEFQCWCKESNLTQMEREAARAQCELRILERRGLPVLLRKLKKRPVFVFGLLLSVCAAILLQSFVWFIRVEGNHTVSEERILHALEDAGVRFGAWGGSLDAEQLKNRLLNSLPELSWIAVNRSGAFVKVMCAERNPIEPKRETEGVVNIVASRPGILREIRVINGFCERKTGDIVTTGEILISGVMEWTTHIQATHAMGEVYADTLREIELQCPKEAAKKIYTGRTEICRTIIFQRKRRKISGNSSIFGIMCDRMIETKPWRLPGGYELPVSIETVTLREYRLEAVSLDRAEATHLCSEEALRLISSQMVAGSIRAGSLSLQMNQSSCSCRAAYNCVELISRSVPAELFEEEENKHGKDHQRGEN